MAGFVQSFHIMITPLFVLALIAVDYTRIYFTDRSLRKTFILAIYLTAGAILCEMAYDACVGQLGALQITVTHIACFFFYIFQMCAFYSINLFIDYSINKDKRHTRKMAALLIGILITHLIALLLNLKFEFYYRIDAGNVFHQGAMYWIHPIYCVLAAVIAIVNVYVSRKNVQRGEIVILMLTIALTSTGAILDVIFNNSKLIWPFFCMALLFSYFFIIRRDAFLDPLTGVNNRRSCDEFLRNIVSAKKYQSYGFIMIDLDKFKEINDNLGHAVGDQALRDAAHLMRSCLRRTDFICRYGGDEFLVITANAVNDNLEILVNRLNAALDSFNQRNQRPYRLLMSMGHDVYQPGCLLTPQAFIAHVDALMYQKKQRRRATDPESSC